MTRRTGRRCRRHRFSTCPDCCRKALFFRPDRARPASSGISRPNSARRPTNPLCARVRSHRALLQRGWSCRLPVRAAPGAAASRVPRRAGLPCRTGCSRYSPCNSLPSRSARDSRAFRRTWRSSATFARARRQGSYAQVKHMSELAACQGRAIRHIPAHRRRRLE